MEKGCGSTIWRTYKSEVRGKPERVRRDDPTDPWVELSRKTCSNGPPRSRNTPSDILISKAARRCTQSRGSGRCPASGSFLAARSRTIGTNDCVASACRLFWADHGKSGSYCGPEVGFGEVWNILGSVVIGSRRLRQASGCRSFFFSPSILGNDNVLYHSLFELASPRRVLGALGR
jgi:hypothetical protein